MTDNFNAPIYTGEPPKKKNTTLIIVLVVLAVLLCCCCTSIYLVWTYGDSILQALGITY